MGQHYGNGQEFTLAFSSSSLTFELIEKTVLREIRKADKVK